jgi:hypothetical protein
VHEGIIRSADHGLARASSATSQSAGCRIELYLLTDKLCLLTDKLYLLAGKLYLLPDKLHLLAGKLHLLADKLHLLAGKLYLLADKRCLPTGKLYSSAGKESLRSDVAPRLACRSAGGSRAGVGPIRKRRR